MASCMHRRPYRICHTMPGTVSRYPEPLRSLPAGLPAKAFIMNKDIAIIGMAGRFPDARNISELFGNLKQGIDSVRPITEKRLAETTLSPDKHYKSCGYLDDIDKFDHKLFNLSYAEAVNMSPAHRLPLEVVYETF